MKYIECERYVGFVCISAPSGDTKLQSYEWLTFCARYWFYKISCWWNISLRCFPLIRSHNQFQTAISKFLKSSSWTSWKKMELCDCAFCSLPQPGCDNGRMARLSLWEGKPGAFQAVLLVRDRQAQVLSPYVRGVRVPQPHRSKKIL